MDKKVAAACIAGGFFMDTGKFYLIPDSYTNWNGHLLPY
jgi:hypothetical protein